MKKRILIAVACVLLSAVILQLLPPAQPQKIDPTQPPQTHPTQTNPTTPDTHPSTQSAAVRLYCCNESWLVALEELAAEYTGLTGTEVVILQPQQEDCQETLARLMESEDPPTVLCVHNQSQLENWKDSLLDLRDTAFGAAICTDRFGLYLDGKLLAVPMDLEGFGLMLNAQVLGEKGALSRNDIFDSQSLSMAAQILKDNSVKAFPAAQLDVLSALCLLLSGDETQVRTFLDFYAVNAHASGDAGAQFQNGECAFYLGGAWNYSRLFSGEGQALKVRDLDIVPTYILGGMQYFFSTAWCVNGSARQGDLDATMEFLRWLVSAGEAVSAPVDRLQTLTPFADGAFYGNQLEKKLLTYMKTEPAVIRWMPAAGDYSKLMVALQTYLDSRTDENWNLLQVVLKQTGKS